MPESIAAPNVRMRTRRSHTDASAPAASKPATVDELLERISGEYEGLSRQLKVIGRHIERHRDRLGLDGIQQVAAQCEVQPSAVVRFAKHFGFAGFAELQRMFRAGIARQIAPSRNYQGRIRRDRRGCRDALQRGHRARISRRQRGRHAGAAKKPASADVEESR